MSAALVSQWGLWAVWPVFLAASVAAAATGILFRPGPWYRALKKPRWTPPNLAFPLVWTALYLGSSYGAARVALQPGAGLALAFWAMQIAFNTLWTPVFFGAHRLGGGLFVMAGLIVALLGMVVTFWALDLVAGLLVLPYLAWILVAASLNWWIWRNNPPGGQPLA